MPASLDMLEESLVKKIEVMSRIEEINARQKEILDNPEEVDFDAFDGTIDEKGKLIDDLNLMDEGFQSLYDRVKADIDKNRAQYAEQISRMQKLIEEITAKSASIEAQEHRNKKLADKYFSTARQQIGTGRKSAAAAINYYQTMSGSKDVNPQFLDKKN